MWWGAWKGPGVGELGRDGADAALVLPAVLQTIRELPDALPVDVAACRLARVYGGALDAAAAVVEAHRSGELQVADEGVAGQVAAATTALERIGPKLLAVLAELGATPASRARVVGAGPRRPGRSSPLDKFLADHGHRS